MRKALLSAALLALSAAVVAWALVPSTLNDFFLPGSQPGQSGNIEHPGKCDNCHGGYDQVVEPAFNWRGSMMAQAARDPLFYACMAIANQDAPDAGDLCIRCHSPDGWLQGRSIPTDGSALNNNDREGVQCDFCHKLIKPTPLGVNPYPDDAFYSANTYDADQAYLSTLATIPDSSGNGMYICDANNAKRGPYADAAARHQMFYSPFHQEAALCGTCHDVSNPAFDRNPDDTYTPNDWDLQAPSFDPYTMFPIERTYSEWLLSAYNSDTGIYAPQFGGNKQRVSTCQDCHMRDVSGYGCNKRGAPWRDDLPLHDMTGGNTFIPKIIDQAFPGETDPAALQAGIQRAEDMLQKAATMSLAVDPNGTDYQATVTVVNETGHKLPSGYPEGRRIWINLKVYDESGVLIKESGAYNFETGELTHDSEAKIYEIKPGIADPVMADSLGIPVGPSFHFVLNHKIFSDNRIPPRGFTNANFELIQSPPVGYTYADGQHSDETQYFVPAGAARVVATLYYQTTTKEYVTFLRDKNITNDWGNILYNLWDTNGKSAPVVMQVETVDLVPVVEQPPVADFAASPQSGDAPLAVSFTDLSTNSPTGWLWDFGDAGSSTLQNPAHSYASAGVYTVSLVASNDFGADTQVKTNFITVTQPSQLAVHVDDITVTRSGRNTQRGGAAVVAVDQDGLAVQGASILGYFNAPDNSIQTGITDANGVTLIQSNKTRTPPADWCFTVVDIQLSGATYDTAANVVTSACESGPALGASGAMAASEILDQNWPNPFNPSTDISFNLPEASRVRLDVYNVMGQRVATLVDGYLEAGPHTFAWDGSSVASGIYLYRLEAGSIVQTRKMVLLK